MEIIVLGAGTMAQEVTDLIDDIGRDKVIGYCVSDEVDAGKRLNNKPIWYASELPDFLGKVKIVRGIFSPNCFNLIKQVENMGFSFVSVIHPSASISKQAEIQSGVVINRLVAVGCGAVINSHCLINRGCMIGHHCFLEEGVTFGPGVNLAGNVYVGKGTLIGMGTNVIQNVIIDADQKIRANSLVIT